MLESGAIAAEPLIRVENLAKHFPVTRGLLIARISPPCSSTTFLHTANPNPGLPAVVVNPGS